MKQPAGEAKEIGLDHQLASREKGGVTQRMVAGMSRLTGVLEIQLKASVPCQLIGGVGHRQKDDEEQEKGWHG